MLALRRMREAAFFRYSDKVPKLMIASSTAIKQIAAVGAASGARPTQ